VSVTLGEVVEVILTSGDVSGAVGERVVGGFMSLDVIEIALFERFAKRVLGFEDVVDIFLVSCERLNSKRHSNGE
jgi:hypothetical protein